MVTRTPRLIKTTERLGGIVLFNKRFFTRPVYVTDEHFIHSDICVPKGFRTDLVSAPWYCRPFLPLKMLAGPAILHDILRRDFLDMAKWKTDLKFLEYMYEFNVPEPWKTLVWLSVRKNNTRA